MVMVHDLSHLNGAAPIELSRLSHSVALALDWGGQQMQAPAGAGGGPRWDSGGSRVIPSRSRTLDAWHRHNDGILLQNRRLGPGVLEYYRHCQEQRVQAAQARADALGVRLDASFIAGGVGGFPRDFEFIRTKVWEEALQPLSALTMFPIDSSVPLGARTHTARREIGGGTAAIHRGGTEIPRATIGFVEQQFGVVYVVSSVGTNFFEQLTTDFANIQAYEKGLKRAKRLVEERVNDIFLFGDTASQVYGVLKYPDLPKKVLPLAFTDAGSPDYRAQIRQLQDLGNEPVIQSGTRFAPNRVAISPELNAFLSTRKHETSGGTDTTMLEYWLRTNTLGITKVDVMPELSNIGPAAAPHGVLYWRDDSDTVQLELIQPPTTLPVYQSSPLDQETVVYAALGGAVMGDVGNCILGYCSVTLN